MKWRRSPKWHSSGPNSGSLSARRVCFEYAVGSLARKMRTVRDLRRLMRTRAEPGEAGETAMDAVIARLVDLKYLSDTRFAAGLHASCGRKMRSSASGACNRIWPRKASGKNLIASTIATAYEDVDEVGAGPRPL